MLQLNIKRFLAVVLDISLAMRHRGRNRKKLVWGHGDVMAFWNGAAGPAPAACSGRRTGAWKNYSHKSFHTSKIKCKTRTVNLQASQVEMEAIVKGKHFFILVFFSVDNGEFVGSSQFYIPKFKLIKFREMPLSKTVLYLWKQFERGV